MYNGIGLTTVRGSGTSGHVQSNKFNLRGPPRTDRADGDRARPPPKRAANQDILEHNRKREIELQIELKREELEDSGMPEEEIEEKLAKYREELQAKAAAQAAGASKKADRRDNDTHAVAQRKEQKMASIRNAFGFSQDIKEGEAFDKDVQEQKKQDRIAAREERELKWKEDQRQKQKAEERRRREREDERRREEKMAKRFKRDRHYERGDTGPDRYDGERGASPENAPIVAAAAVAAGVEEAGEMRQPPAEGGVIAPSPSPSPPRRKTRESRSPPRRRSDKKRRSRSVSSRSSSGTSSSGTSSSSGSGDSDSRSDTSSDSRRRRRR